MILVVEQGIALINGTQMISSLGAEAVERALGLARQADIIAALTLEALRGSTKAFHSGTSRTPFFMSLTCGCCQLAKD